MTYRYTVQNIEHQGDVLLLTLKPVGAAMPFTPGQYAAISFRRGGRPTPARCFSLVSTPRSGVLQFAMRVKGNFTHSAANLQTGEKVAVQGPFGDFTVNPDYDRRIVMLAGGIGITPCLSILRDLTEQQVAVPVTVLYANRSASRIPFEAPLRALVQRNRYLQVRFFSDDTTGSVTENHVRQLAGAGNSDTTYFICGPKSFSRNMQRMLERAGIHQARIVSESFTQGSAVTLGRGWSVPRLTYLASAAVFALTFGCIMLLDLVRAMPKLVAQAKPTTSTQRTDTTTQDDTSSSNSSSNTATTAPTQTTTPSQSYYTYQPPVSRVS